VETARACFEDLPSGHREDMDPDPALEGVAQDAMTLGEVLEAFEAEGFHGQFVARRDAIVECVTCKTKTPARDVAGDHRLRRLEGASDPADMLAVAALVCPSCGTQGTLVLNYGPEASQVDDEVLRSLDVPSGDDDSKR
jgi:hypothetical protein